MIAQRFGFTRDFPKAWNNSVYFQLRKMSCGFKDQTRFCPSAEKCGLGSEFEPKAQQVKAGSADLCFIADTPINEAIEHFREQAVDIIDGPVERSGASGAIVSLYLRDPDGNLIEISNYLNDEDNA